MKSIGWAVKELQDGRRVRRSGWNGKSAWLVLVRGSSWNLDLSVDVLLSVMGKLGESGYHRRADFVARCATDGSLIPWLCSQSDLLATDWCSV